MFILGKLNLINCSKPISIRSQVHQNSPVFCPNHYTISKTRPTQPNLVTCSQFDFKMNSPLEPTTPITLDQTPANEERDFRGDGGDIFVTFDN